MSDNQMSILINGLDVVNCTAWELRDAVKRINELKTQRLATLRDEISALSGKAPRAERKPRSDKGKPRKLAAESNRNHRDGDLRE